MAQLDTQRDLKQRWEAEYADDWVQNVLPRLVFAPALIEPELARLLGDVRGRRILDAGCGEGVYSRYLANAGASVVGIDGSEKMIRYARDKAPQITFQAADLLETLDFPDATFDAVISAGVLMSLPKLDTFLAESIRILRPCGVLAVAVHHPAFSNPTMRLHHPLWARVLRKPIVGLTYSYFEERHDIAEDKAWPFYHRTIEDYVDAFRKPGFHIDRITEPHEIPKEMLETSNVEYVTRLPRFMFFKLVKPQGAPSA